MKERAMHVTVTAFKFASNLQFLGAFCRNNLKSKELNIKLALPII